MIWAGIILLFLLIGISPVVFFVGLALVFFVVLTDGSESNKQNDLPFYYSPADNDKPWK